MSTVTKELIQQIKERDDAAKAEYTALVRRIHGGDHVDPDESLDTLRLAGKTPEDLERDIERARRIVELETIIAEKPALEEERQKFGEKHMAEVEALKAERTAIEEKGIALDGRYNSTQWEFQIRGRRITDAQRELNALLRPPLPQPAPAPIVPAGVMQTEYHATPAPLRGQ